MKILLATDGSPTSMKALDYVANIAGPLQAGVTVLAVANEVPLLKNHEGITFAETVSFEQNITEGMQKMAQCAIDMAKEAFEGKGIDVSTKIIQGNPADVIIREAEEGGYDLLVIGSRGLGGVKGMLLGSVSSKVVNRIHTNVTIIK